jgi:hypothetical protein
MNKTRLLLVLASLLVLSGCAVDQKDMARLMRQEGVTEWKPTGKKFFLCGPMTAGLRRVRLEPRTDSLSRGMFVVDR